MKVSIITATYNSATTVKDTLVSVQSQTYTNIEHIIVDGGSKDETLALVQQINPICIVRQQSDTGIYDAMNKGIAFTTGDIVGILNSDDFYSDTTVIETVVDIFKKTGCDTLYGDLLYVDAIDTNKIIRQWVSGNYNRNHFLYGWMPPHPTFFVRKSLYNRLGSFNLSLRSAADYELMLRFLYKEMASTEYLAKVLVHMRTGGQSNRSVMNRLRANIEDRKAWKINGLKPRWFTLFLKPLRKVSQFFIQ